MGYSQGELPRAATLKAAYAAVQLCPGGDYNQLLLLSFILHFPLLPYSLTSGTLSRVYCRAVLPGEDEGSPQRAAEQIFGGPHCIPTGSSAWVYGEQRLKLPP